MMNRESIDNTDWFLLPAITGNHLNTHLGRNNVNGGKEDSFNNQTKVTVSNNKDELLFVFGHNTTHCTRTTQILGTLA